SAVATTFAPDVAGTYDVTLMVDDGSATDTHAIVVVAYDGVLVPDQFGSVAEALANAAGQAVGIRPGSWPATLTVDGDGVTLVGLGASPDAVVLEGDGQAPVLDVRDGNRVRLANLTVTRGFGVDGGGLAVADSDDLELDGVVVRDNDAQRGGGVFATQTDIRLRETVFVGNQAADAGGGMYVAARGRALDATGSTFAQNAADRGGAVFVDGGERCFEDPASFDGRFEASRFAFNVAREGAALAHEGPTGRIALAHVDVVGQSGGSVLHADGAAYFTTSSAFVGNGEPGVPFVTGRTAVYTSFGAALAFDNAEPPAASLVDAAPGWALVTDDAELDDLFGAVRGSPLRDAGIGEDRDGSPADIGSCGGVAALPRCLRFGRDAEGDGLDDGWEVAFGLDPTSADGAGDPDADGLSNAGELAAGSHPADADSDEDGVSDNDEVQGADDPTDDADFRPRAGFATALDPDTGAVVLDGTGSTDPQGTMLGFAWSLETPAGSPAAIDTPDQPTAGFLADLANGVYRTTLVVDDGVATSRPVRVPLVRPRVRSRVDFASLADAVDALGPFDILQLPGGVQDEDPVTIQNVARIRGDGTTELVATEAGAPMFDVVEGGRLELFDLTVRSGNAETGAGVFCERGELVAERVVFRDHIGQFGPAVRTRGCTTTFTDVDLLDNEADRDAGALVGIGGSLTWVRGVASGNRAGIDGGAALLLGVEADIRNVLFVDNHADGRGLVFYFESGPEFEPGPSTFRHLTLVRNGIDGTGTTVFFEDAIRTEQEMTDLIFADNDGTREIEADETLTVSVDRVALDRRVIDVVRQVPPLGSGSADPVVLGDEVLEEVVNFGFGDPEGGDFRLDARSVVLDQGAGLDRDATISDYGTFGGPDAADGWDLYLVDTDGDGFDDGWERLAGLDPLVADDGDADLDVDGLTTSEEYGPIPIDGRLVRTLPLTPDTDGDGLDDGAELAQDRDPTRPDGLANISFIPSEVSATVGQPANVLASATRLFSVAQWSIVHQPPSSTLDTDDLVQVDDLQNRFSQVTLVPQVPGRIVLGVEVVDVDGPTGLFTVEIWVDGDLTVPGDYGDLEAAIADVSANSAVRVAAGTYFVNVVRDRSTTIIGDGPATTVFDGSRAGPVVDHTSGLLTLEGVMLTNGRGILGGGVYSASGNVALVDVVLDGNEALDGGGIYLDNSNLTARGVSVTENVAARDGGGIALVTQLGTRQLDMTQSLVAGNLAVDEGGGVYVNRVDARFGNTIFADNRAEDGGAIRVIGFEARGSLELDHVTATYNSADEGAFIDLRALDTLTIRNTILFRQQDAPDLRIVNTSPIPDLTMEFTLLTGNLQPPFDFGSIPTSVLPVPTNTPDNGNQIGTGAPGFVNIDAAEDWLTHDWMLNPALSTAIDAGEDADGNVVDLGAFGGVDGGWTPR
ncbi:MAG: hypothetical protein AAF211_00680, partial [Myxococcota bacterium]